MYTKSTTLKDVSEKSGFSLRTVKKVMGGDQSVRPETREHIMTVAKELNYRKNQMASILASNRPYNIGIVIGSYKYFFPEVRQGFMESVEGFKDCKISIEFLLPADKSVKTAQELLTSLVKRTDIDAVIMHASSMSGLNKQINALIQAGKPVFTIGADAPQSSRLCYIGPKAYESGRIASQIMANYIGKRGTVCIINQVIEEMQTVERSRGFVERVQECYPNIHVEQITVMSAGKSYYNTVRELVQTQGIAGILCTDADCYIAGQVLQDLGNTDVVVVGFDLTDEVGSLMKQGYIKVILDQNPKQQAALALQKMCEYITYGTKIDSNIYVPVSILTGECLRYAEG